MKIYRMEFTYFDKYYFDNNNYKSVKIIASSRIELIRTFLNLFSKKDGKAIWKEESKFIEELTLPIIE